MMVSRSLYRLPRRFRHWSSSQSAHHRRAKKVTRSTSAREEGAVKITGRELPVDGERVGESTTLFAEIQPGAWRSACLPKPERAATVDPARVKIWRRG